MAVVIDLQVPSVSPKNVHKENITLCKCTNLTYCTAKLLAVRVMAPLFLSVRVSTLL